MENDRIVITPEQALALLADSETVHTFSNPAAGMLIGADWDYADAVEAIKGAKHIELAGEQARASGHPLAIWVTEKRLLFFEADMAKVETFEARASEEGRGSDGSQTISSA